LTGSSCRVVDEHSHVAGTTAGVSVAGALRRPDGQTQVHVASRRDRDRPAARQRRRHGARVRRTGERAVHVAQISSTAFTTTSATQNLVPRPTAGFCHLAILTALSYSPVYTGDKVEFNTVDFVESRQSRPCRFGPVHTGNKVDQVGDCVDTTPTSSCRIQVVADLSPKPATKSTVSGQQSTLLPICRRFRQQSTLSPVCTGLKSY